MSSEAPTGAIKNLKSCLEKFHLIFILSHLFLLTSDITYPFSTKFSDELLFLSRKILDKKTITSSPNHHRASGHE